MICSSCQHENPDGAKFCNGCGASLAAVCAGCGMENPAGAKFCNQCGNNLQESVIDRAPADYTPKHLSDRILQSKSALEGERKQVTVMFADVKGSMDLAGQLDPEDWHKILDRFFEILGEGVHRFEGTINQYTGDGIMALFGAPIAHEDHAQRACFAALQVRDEVARYSTEVKREHGVGFSVRMGLNSGEVVVGAIGDDLRMDYTAQGQTVGLAQRMESLAEPNTCYMTEWTAALAGGYFDLIDLGDFSIKGAAERIGVYDLKGIGQSVTRFDLSRARGLSRFVGRATDIRTLEDALEQTDAGNGQVVGIVAEAGTGKSRLCFEFLEQCRARGMKVFEGRAVAHGRNIPFLPILEVFRAYFGITRQDDDQMAREKIAGRMVLLDQAFADTLPLIFDFLSVADPNQPALDLDADVRQRQLIAVMRQLIHTVNEEQPTITMIEDLHWLDAASEEFIEHMVDARAGARNMLLLNFRPEYSAEWMQKSWYRQIPLTPLGVDAIAGLLAYLLGPDPSLDGLPKLVHARTAGNPFFTEEIAQTLIESEYLEGAPGAYKLVTPVEELEVPATVQAVLAARIDRLPEREKQLLQTAAVIGKDFPEYLLTSVSDLSPDDLKNSLAELRRAEFILEQSIYPTVEYAFKHPLTQEVALSSQLKDRRKKVHAKVAKAIEENDTHHADEYAALLAHHYDKAGDLQAAADWHSRAARWASQNDLNAGIRHWTRVRELTRALPDDEATARLGLAACNELLTWIWRFGVTYEENQALLEEGERYAGVLDDELAMASMALRYNRNLTSCGRIQEYYDRSRVALEQALALGDVNNHANAIGFFADAAHWCGKLQESLDACNTGIDTMPRDVPREEWAIGISPYSVCVFWRALNLCWLGNLADGLAEVERVRQISVDDGTPEVLGYLGGWSAQIDYFRLEPKEAYDKAHEANEIRETIGNPSSLYIMANIALACAHLAAGKPEEAVEPAKLAAEKSETVERQHRPMCISLLADAYLQSANLGQAVAIGQEAIRTCQEFCRRNVEVYASGITARALLRANGLASADEAELLLKRASDLIELTGAQILAPHLLEWRAELAKVRGNESEHERLVDEARAGYEAMGSTGHVYRLDEVVQS